MLDTPDLCTPFIFNFISPGGFACIVRCMITYHWQCRCHPISSYCIVPQGRRQRSTAQLLPLHPYRLSLTSNCHSNITQLQLFSGTFDTAQFNWVTNEDQKRISIHFEWPLFCFLFCFELRLIPLEHALSLLCSSITVTEESWQQDKFKIEISRK